MTESPMRIDPVRLKETLKQLIDIYSPAGKEVEVLRYIEAVFKKYNVPYWSQPVDEHRYNLLVTPPSREIELAMVGHVDTVMAPDLVHYGYREEGDLVVGLGSADMKGGCAAMVEAFLCLWESGRRDLPVALALVVGEEEDGDGAQKLIRDVHFPRAVIGEPTDLKPCLGHFGYVEIHLTMRGERRHASLANSTENPIQGMLRLLLQFSDYFQSARKDSVFNIRELSSSRAGFAVPEHCEAWLDVHLPPSSPLGDIVSEIEDLFHEQSSRCFQSLAGRLRFNMIHSGYTLPEKGLMVDVLKKLYQQRGMDWQTDTFPSHSDANVFWSAGVKPLLLGPGQLEKAHARDECVSFGQVVQAAQIYTDLLASFGS